MSWDANPGRPELLILAGARTAQSARLALAARQAGFSVSLVGPASHPVGALDWLQSVQRYSPLRPGRSIVNALNARPFDLVIPVDDFVTPALFAAHSSGRLNETARNAVKRSLGDTSNLGRRYSRVGLAEVATRNGLPVPLTRAAVTEEALIDAVGESGLPAVLKVDGGCSGLQVTVVDDRDSALDAYRTLSQRTRLKSGIGGMIFDRDTRVMGEWFSRITPRVSVQSFVAGDAATLSGVAWEGRALASVSLKVVHTESLRGPATVVEPIESADMQRAAEVVAREFGLSGPFGLDFVLDGEGRAVLLELNPRATPTLHLLTPSVWRPLLHVLAEQVGVHVADTGARLPAGRIALYPQAVAVGVDLEALEAHLEVPDSPEVTALCRSFLAMPPRPATGPLVGALRRVL